MLARIRKAKEENEGGFTLIELLVVVVIIGILAAIAIPTFLNQREKAWERAATSDLRNAAVKMEEYFSEFGTYADIVGLTDDDDTADVDESTFAAKTSDGVELTAAPNTDPKSGYCLKADHTQLGDEDSIDFVLDSAVGRPVAGTTC